MAGISLEFDAAGTLIGGGDPGTALALSSANGYALLGFEMPEAERFVQWAGSIDTEGDLSAASKTQNRTVTARYRLTGASDAALETSFNTLDKKVGKLNASGGTLKLTTPAGTVGVLDVRSAAQAFGWDHRLLRLARAEVSFTLTCAPFIRAASETDLGDNSETSLPVLVWSDTVPGAVDALGRIVVDDDSGNDQWAVFYGVEDDSLYTHTTTSGSGSLWYEAESRTALGGAATAVGASGASGAGSNVVRQGTLTAAWQAMLSTQASGGGAHLTHAGTFNVFAHIYMPTSNTGAVSVGLEYSQGDFRRSTRVSQIAFEAGHSREGQWIFQRLGQVTIPKAKTGTHRWEARIIAKSTIIGDDLDIDYIALFPTQVYGEASAVITSYTPTSFSARDEFDQTAGALTGKTAPVGGVWAGAGAATDFTVETTGHTAQRTVITEGTDYRYAISGVAAFTTQTASVDFKTTVAQPTLSGIDQGVVARYVNATNWLAAQVIGGPSERLEVGKNIAGTYTPLASVSGWQTVANTWYTLQLMADATGRWFLWAGLQDAARLTLVADGHDSVLATGGTLASGKPGFLDFGAAASPVTRNYDRFAAWVPALDAAVFASQSLELRHDSVVREDSTGTYWDNVSRFGGNHLLLPPARNEGRSTRFIVKAVRNDPDTSADSAIDDISAHAYAIPRYLSMPD